LHLFTPAPPSESLNKKVKKVVILQLNYSLEKIGLLSELGRRFGVILSGGRGVKKHAIFLSTHGNTLEQLVLCEWIERCSFDLQNRR
jgi:hypothetical protein